MKKYRSREFLEHNILFSERIPTGWYHIRSISEQYLLFEKVFDTPCSKWLGRIRSFFNHPCPTCAWTTNTQGCHGLGCRHASQLHRKACLLGLAFGQLDEDGDELYDHPVGHVPQCLHMAAYLRAKCSVVFVVERTELKTGNGQI